MIKKSLNLSVFAPLPCVSLFRYSYHKATLTFFFLFCVFKLFKLMLNLCSIRDSGTQGRVTNTLKVKRLKSE